MNNPQKPHFNRSLVSRLGFYAALVGMLMLLSACPKTGEDIDAAQASNTTNANPSNKLIQLPVEVFGAEGAQNTVSFKLSAAEATNGKSLWLQTHNVRYPEKASVSINGGDWIALSNTTAEMIGNSKTYGGIGGSIATLQMTLPITSGALKEGDNTLDFRFNVSNGVSNGYRVIGLNVLDASSNKLIAPNNFTEVDPASFTAPSTQASDIDAGRDLWNNAPLQKNFLANAPSIIARCADCHTASGADLKYFGYSNKAIIERAKFHGLNDAQGEQIASYIRSLAVKAVGRPWNPPYQPGPGITAKPNDEWAAGAGMQSVLENDLDTINAIFPEGIKRDALIEGGDNSTKFKRFSTHDTPIAFQLPDWNHWLPEVHPYDAFGKDWSDQHLGFRIYKGIRQKLTGLTPEQIRQWYRNSSTGGGDPLKQTGWFAFKAFSYHAGDEGIAGDARTLLKATLPASNFDQFGGVADPETAKKIYSLGLWKVVKMFELNEEFQLTSMGPEAVNLQWASYDSTEALPRMWVGANRAVFDVSPFLLKLTGNVTGSATGNNTFNHNYLSNSWYQLQLILNAGQRSGYNHQVLDWGYTQGFLSGFDEVTKNNQTARNVIWAIKGMDEGDNEKGPNRNDGWSTNRANPDRFLGLYNVVVLSKTWIEAPTQQAKDVLALLRQVYLEKNASWLPIEFATDVATGNPKDGQEDGINFNRPDYVVNNSPSSETLARSEAENIYRLMPEYIARKTYPAALQNGYAAWTQAIWPGVDANGVARNNWLQFTVPRVGSAPAAPTVAAGTTVDTVNISWGNSGAASYNVKRSDSPTGPFLTIAYFRTGTSYTEKVPLPGTGRTYYYRISTNSDAGESPDSTSALIAR